MSRKRKIALLVSLSFIVWVTGCSHVNKERPNENESEEIQRLISELVSTDDLMKFSKVYLTFHKYPAKYYEPLHTKSRKRVDEAKQKLLEFGKKAFPILLKNLDDDRDSEIVVGFVFLFPPPIFTVGDICRGLISSTLVVSGPSYNARTAADGSTGHCPDFFAHVYDRDLHKWWEKNKYRSLKQMQIDCLSWRIRREKFLGTIEEDEKWFNKYIEKLEDTLKKIKSSNQI